MKTIAYYISDYGHGHAARSIAVIRFLLRKYPEIKVAICCSFAMNFIKQSLESEDQNRLHFHFAQNDFGFILKKNSIEVDSFEINKQYDHYIDGIWNYVGQEKGFLSFIDADLVVSDISPLPFLAAKQLEIRTVGISNFTWYRAYQDIIPSEKLQILYDTYNQMGHFIPLAGDDEPKWRGKIHPTIDYFSREIDNAVVDKIRKELDPENERFLVYFGLGMKIGIDDLSTLKLWDSKQCVFVVSGNTAIEGSNIYKIPSGETETQNYIAACDMVISKPGWGTVSEAIQSCRPLLILERSNMREDQNTIDYLRSKKWCHLLPWSDLPNFQVTDAIKHQMTQLAAQIHPSMSNHQVLDQLTGRIIECLSPPEFCRMW
jgi:UDP-N-acetylglucosamine transferase subunit ALG13